MGILSIVSNVYLHKGAAISQGKSFKNSQESAVKRIDRASKLSYNWQLLAELYF